MEFHGKGEIGKLPKLLHHLWLRDQPWEFAEACNDAMPLATRAWAGRFKRLSSTVGCTKAERDKAIKATQRATP